MPLELDGGDAERSDGLALTVTKRSRRLICAIPRPSTAMKLGSCGVMTETPSIIRWRLEYQGASGLVPTWPAGPPMTLGKPHVPSTLWPVSVLRRTVPIFRLSVCAQCMHDPL